MLDPSEVDRITSVTAVPITRLVDWKNRVGQPFEMRVKVLEGGLFELAVDSPEPLKVERAVPLVHGDYESKREEDGTLVYRSLPGNTLGQTMTPDGRPTFAVAHDLTELDTEGRPIFKIYFGQAAAWFVKNAYHQKWNDVREARLELEPPPAPSAADPDERVGKERGQNPRARQRQQEREQRSGGSAGRSRRGGRGRGRA